MSKNLSNICFSFDVIIFSKLSFVNLYSLNNNTLLKIDK